MELNPALIFPMIELLVRRQRTATRDADARNHGDRIEAAPKPVPDHAPGSERAPGEPSPTWNSPSNRWRRRRNAFRVLAPQEAVVAIGIEMTIGEVTGMMNLAIPSVILKMMRQKFDQQWTARKVETDPARRAAILKKIRSGAVRLEATMVAPPISIRDLVWLEEGDMLMVDHPAKSLMTLKVNGMRKYQGRAANADGKRAFAIESAGAGGLMRGEPETLPPEFEPLPVALLDSLPEGVWFADRQGIIRFWSKRGRGDYGIRRGRSFGRALPRYPLLLRRNGNAGRGDAVRENHRGRAGAARPHVSAAQAGTQDRGGSADHASCGRRPEK